MHNSQLITFLTQFCLVLYSFWANLLHSLRWLIVSSFSTHNYYLLFCCVLSIFALIQLVLMALFSVVIRRDSVTLFRFPFSCHFRVFSCAISSVCRLKSPNIYFSHFCFLVFVVFLSGFIWPMYLLATMISLSLIFLMLSSSLFIGEYSLSSSSLGFKTLCIAINFLFVIILIIQEFFIPVLVDGFPLESWVITSLALISGYILVSQADLNKL